MQCTHYYKCIFFTSAEFHAGVSVCLSFPGGSDQKYWRKCSIGGFRVSALGSQCRLYWQGNLKYTPPHFSFYVPWWNIKYTYLICTMFCLNVIEYFNVKSFFEWWCSNLTEKSHDFTWHIPVLHMWNHVKTCFWNTSYVMMLAWRQVG